MSVRKKTDNEEGIYFVTITCYKWISLFEKADAWPCVFNWFDALKAKGNSIAAFVIMPNHLHTLIHFSNTAKSIDKYISNGKRFMAYEIVNKLKEKNEAVLISTLKKGVNNTQKELGKIHEVFEPSFDCKRCMTNAFTMQKLNYIHHNPVKGKWRLAENAVDYLYSSMKQYETGEKGIYEITPLSSIECFSFL